MYVSYSTIYPVNLPTRIPLLFNKVMEKKTNNFKFRLTKPSSSLWEKQDAFQLQIPIQKWDTFRKPGWGSSRVSSKGWALQFQPGKLFSLFAESKNHGGSAGNVGDKEGKLEKRSSLSHSLKLNPVGKSIPVRCSVPVIALHINLSGTFIFDDHSRWTILRTYKKCRYFSIGMSYFQNEIQQIEILTFLELSFSTTTPGGQYYALTRNVGTFPLVWVISRMRFSK